MRDPKNIVTLWEFWAIQALLAATVACAGANRAATVAVVNAEARTHAALVAANNKVNQLCDPGAFAEVCRPIRLALATLHDTAASFARSILAGKWDAFVKFVNDAAAAVQAVRALPASDLRDALIGDLQRAVPNFSGGTP